MYIFCRQHSHETHHTYTIFCCCRRVFTRPVDLVCSTRFAYIVGIVLCLLVERTAGTGDINICTSQRTPDLSIDIVLLNAAFYTPDRYVEGVSEMAARLPGRHRLFFLHGWQHPHIGQIHLQA